MPEIPMRYRVDLDKTINTTPLNTLFAMGDDQAHRFELTITHGSVAADLTGCTVKGKFVSFSNNMTVNLTGSVTGGNAVVTLTQACYAQLGRFALVIQIIKGSVKTSVFYGDGYMRSTTTDNAIDGNYIVYDTNVLLSKIQEIENAISGANAAISNANAAAEHVDANMDAKITARVDKTLIVENGIADAKTVGDEIGSLKNDIGNLATFGKNLFDKNKAVIGYALDDNGELTNDSSVFMNAHQYLTSDFIPCFKYVGMYFCIAPQNGAIYFYDENKRFISKVSNIKYSHGRKIINGAYYFRFITPKSALDTTTARVFDTMPIEAPVYDDYGIKINDDVNIKSDDSKLDKNQGADNFGKYMQVDVNGDLNPSQPPVDDRLYIGKTVTNAGQQEETISIGVNAGRNTQNGYIAIGHGAMGKATESTTDNDNGKYSTAIGHRALGNNLTGDHNTAVGWGCMGGNTTGNGNTAIGEDALCHGNGDSNTCVGNRAYQRGQGSRNVVIGASAMYTSDYSVEIPSGFENVSVGNNSGCPSGNGSRNTCIGHEAKTSEGVEASIAIGYRSRARKSQQVVLGNTTTYKKTIETVLVGDIVVMGTDNIFRKLSFNEDGSISWTDVSTDYADYLIN